MRLLGKKNASPPSPKANATPPPVTPVLAAPVPPQPSVETPTAVAVSQSNASPQSAPGTPLPKARLDGETEDDEEHPSVVGTPEPLAKPTEEINLKYIGPPAITLSHNVQVVPMAGLEGVGLHLKALGEKRGASDPHSEHELLLDALDLQEKNLGANHREVCLTLATLGATYNKLENFEVGRQCLERAAAALEGTELLPHVLLDLAESYYGLGERQKRRAVLAQIVSLRDDVLNASVYRGGTARVLFRLADACGDDGQVAAQVAAMRKALRHLENDEQSSPGELCECYKKLGSVLEANSQFTLAAEAFEKALSYQARIYGLGSFPCLGIVGLLADCYGRLGRQNQQFAALEEVLAIAERKFPNEEGDGCLNGEELQFVVRQFITLIELFKKQGREKEMILTMERCLPIVVRLGDAQSLGLPPLLETFARVGFVTERDGLLPIDQTNTQIGNLRRKQLLQDMVAVLRKRREAAPFGSSQSDSGLALMLVELGKLHTHLGELEPAARLLEEALQMQQLSMGRTGPGLLPTLYALSQTGNEAMRSDFGQSGRGRQACLERALDIRMTLLKESPDSFSLEHAEEIGRTLRELGCSHSDLVSFALSANKRETAAFEAKAAEGLFNKALVVQEQSLGVGHLEVAKTLMEFGKLHRLMSNNSGAVSTLERALPIFEARRGRDHRDIATLMLDLGQAYADLGMHMRSRECFERALALLEHHGRHDSENKAIVGGVLAKLGLVYGSLGEIARMRDTLELALPIVEGNGVRTGLRDGMLGTILLNLANAYGIAGDAKLQRDFAQRALAAEENEFGPVHPRLAEPLVCLADAHGALGDYEEQQILLERLMESQEIAGDEATLASTMDGLAEAFLARGDLERARCVRERIVALELLRHGVEPHADMAIALRELATIYGSLGCSSHRKVLLERALHIFHCVVGSESLEVALTLAALGTAKGCLGDGIGMLADFLEALPILKKHGSEGHADVGVGYARLSAAWWLLGDRTKQRDFLWRALPILVKELGCGHPEALHAHRTLRKLLRSSGDKESLEGLEIAWQMGTKGSVESVQGRDLSNLSRWSDHFGILSIVRGGRKCQQALLERTLVMQEQQSFALGVTGRTGVALHPAAVATRDEMSSRGKLTDTLEAVLDTGLGITLLELGELHLEDGDNEAAREILARATDVMRHEYGKGHVSTAASLRALATACGACGDEPSKIQLLKEAWHIQLSGLGMWHPDSLKTERLLRSCQGFDEKSGDKVASGDPEAQATFLLKNLFADQVVTSVCG